MTSKEILEQTKWIPCSERLPEENGRYLVTRGLKACDSLWNRVYIVNYSDLMGLKKEKIWWSGNVGKSDFERHDDVLAWMPLPEAWSDLRNMLDEIEALPPAQPEIIRCKDCKFYTPMNRETKTGICRLLMHQNFGDDWHCAGAERRTDESNMRDK